MPPGGLAAGEAMSGLGPGGLLDARGGVFQVSPGGFQADPLDVPAGVIPTLPSTSSSAQPKRSMLGRRCAAMVCGKSRIFAPVR